MQAVNQDESIREQIRLRLAEHSEVDASQVEVEVEKGRVTLSGIVDSRYIERIAREVAAEVEGVHRVESRLHVQHVETGGPVLTTREPGANLDGSTQRS